MTEKDSKGMSTDAKRPRRILLLGLTVFLFQTAYLNEGVFPVPAAQTAWPEMPRYAAMESPEDNPMTPGKIELGKQLFYDRRLSGDGTRGCFFCHLTRKGLTNGRGDAVGAYKVKISRSPPTLWNIGYYSEFYWDGRSKSLEALVKDAWSGPLLGASGQEGHPSVEDICRQLDAIEGYRKQFEEVFGEVCTPDNVAKAIAAFGRTIVANNSAWARFWAGNQTALSEKARHGWEIFRGKGRCTNCHDGVLLTDQQYHNIGIGMDTENPDLGRYNVTKNGAHRGAFKTPTLLDISKSAPYFHDGSAAKLEDAVDIMLAGGIDNPWLDRTNLRPPVELCKREREDLLTFLGELTVVYTVRPPRLPK